MARPTVFDLASAARIAAAVRKVEIGDRAEAALTFRRELPQQQRKTFRIATFTGAWAIGASKVVTYKYQTATPNTAVAVNLFFPMPAPSGATDCAIAKDGTAWYLIDVPFATATTVIVTGVVTQTVVSNVQIAASLNTSNCTITVTRTQTTAAVTVVSTTQTATILAFKVT